MTLEQVRKLIERVKEQRAPHSDVCAVRVKDLDALESTLNDGWNDCRDAMLGAPQPPKVKP